MLLTALLAPLSSAAQPAPPAAPAPQPVPSAKTPPPDAGGEELMGVIDQLRYEAGRLLPTVKSLDARRFLIATSFLPVPGDRQIYTNREKRSLISEQEYEALPADQKAGYTARSFSQKDYYYTRYGSPLAYVRLVDLLATREDGQNFIKGKRVLDYGFGTIGHLRLLALLGADVTGVEVDPTLRAAYTAPFDTGIITGAPFPDDAAPDGTLNLVFGSFPKDAAVAEAVGQGYDLIVSKNTLKNGYINPEQKVDKRMLVDLGVPRAEFLKDVATRLKPGGLFLIYNICPAQKKEPEKWIPWADGRCPFPREEFDAAGLEILALDADDTAAAREVGAALEWDQGPQPMDLQNDLFAHYTLARKKP